MNEKHPKISQSKQRPVWIYIVLRILIYMRIPVLSVISLFVGLWVGYVVLGKQQSSDVFKWGTWKHVWDLVFAN